MLALVRILVVSVILMVGSSSVRAQGPEQSRPSGMGIGAEAMLIGPSGLAILYNSDVFHINGILGFVDYENTSTLALGGRFLYHLHSTAMADFSIGGGLGLVNVFRDNQDDAADFVLEGLVQIRAFIVDNVALSASAGVAADAGENDLFVISGQLVGSVGIGYYFW